MAEQNQQLSIIDNEKTKNKFIQLIRTVHQELKSDDQVNNFYEAEKFSFMREVQEKRIPIQECSQLSVAGTFLEVVRDGLSFGGSAKDVYLLTRSVKTAAGYEKRLYYSLTPDGIIFLAKKVKSIQNISKPAIVYDGDDFAVWVNDDGDQKLTHKPKIPRKEGAKIIAGYVFITHNDGKKEPFWMEEQDWKRLGTYSLKQNERTGKDGVKYGSANALYNSYNGGIDPGFLAAKLVKHGLKNLKKAPVTGSGYIETEDGEYEEYKAPTTIDLSDLPDQKQIQQAPPAEQEAQGEQEAPPADQTPSQEPEARETPENGPEANLNQSPAAIDDGMPQ